MNRGIIMSCCKHTPCVILPGIGQSKVELVNGAGEKIKMAWPLDVEGEEVLGELKMPLAKMMLLRRDAGFSDKVYSAVKDIAEPIATLPDGTMKNSLKVVSYPQSLAECTPDERRYIYKMVPLQMLSERIGEENLFFFSYNSFGDTYEIAAELSDFIDMVKEKTGSDKVNLVPVSLGGALSTVYFRLFRHKKDVKRVMYFVAALGGSHLIADVMEKNIKPENGLAMIEMLCDKETADKAGTFLKLLPKGVFETTINKALDAINETVLVNSMSMWGIIPTERYKALADVYLADEKHKALREKADDFYNFRLQFPSVVKELEAEGVEFFAICGYGLQFLALSGSDKMSTDSIIHIGSTAYGARSAELGEILTDFPEEGRQCKNPDHNHLSPDKTVDAAYGLWPETTWYYYQQRHDDTAYNDNALGVAARVLSDDNFRDIYSDPDFPQFGYAQDNRK